MPSPPSRQSLGSRIHPFFFLNAGLFACYFGSNVEFFMNMKFFILTFERINWNVHFVHFGMTDGFPVRLIVSRFELMLFVIIYR